MGDLENIEKSFHTSDKKFPVSKNVISCSIEMSILFDSVFD